MLQRQMAKQSMLFVTVYIAHFKSFYAKQTLQLQTLKYSLMCERSHDNNIVHDVTRCCSVLFQLY